MSRRDFFQIFCMFYLQCITRKCAKEKNFDIQRNTKVGSGGQFTSNRLSNDHIQLEIICFHYNHRRRRRCQNDSVTEMKI